MAKATRLRDWSGKREAKATFVFKAGEPFRGDTAFATQPGHIPFRARLIAREDRAHQSISIAQRMAAKADEIERQADRAIYSDDEDACLRLAEKILLLEDQRETMKTRNAAYRKAHPELKAVTSSYERDRALPHQAFELSNLGGNISRLRKRLAELKRQKS